MKRWVGYWFYSHDPKRKEALVGQIVDPQVKILGGLAGKVEQMWLVDHYFSDDDLFPYFRSSVYMGHIPLENGEIVLSGSLSLSHYGTPL